MSEKDSDAYGIPEFINSYRLSTANFVVNSTFSYNWKKSHSGQLYHL